MDYDDNDLHSQNFHLAGEGSSKFPPGLQRYALPKFDFDDSHLRFDSLVETEVFLGIEGNQDNHWIEDFSRGSSGIEFNSSAAEPCSISRRNNVWSEATSSESVEMLLNSVGQEEVIAVPVTVEESYAGNELDCLTKQMEHSFEHDENILSKTEDVKSLEQTLPVDVIAGNSSGLGGDVGGGQSRVVDASQIQGGEDSVDGVSNSFDQSADKEKGLLTLNEEGIFADIECDNDKKEVKDLTDKHLYVQMQEQSFDNLVTTTQNIVTTLNEFSSEVQLQTIDDSKKQEDQVLSEGAKMDNQDVDGNVVRTTFHAETHTCSVSEVETVSEISVEVSKTNVAESSRTPLKSANIYMVSGTSEDESFGATDAREGEDVVIYEDTPVRDDQSKADMLDVPLESLTVDTQLENVQVPPIMDEHLDYTKSSKNDTLESGKQLDSENLAPDDLGSSMDNLSTEIYAPSTIVTEPTLINNEDNAYVGTGDNDVFVSEKVNPKVLDDCSNMDIDSPGVEVGPFSSDQGKADNELNSASESDVAITNSSLVSCVASDGIPLPSGGVVIEVDQKGSQISLPVAAANQFEAEEETYITSTEESSDVASKVVVPDSVSEAEGVPRDTHLPVLFKNADQSLPIGSEKEAGTLIKASTSIVDRVSMECTTQLSEGDFTEAVIINNTKAIVEDAAKVLEPTSKNEQMLLECELLPLVQAHDGSKKYLEDSETTLITKNKNSRQTSELNIENNRASSVDQSVQIPASERSQIASLGNGGSILVENIPIPGSPQVIHVVESEDSIKQDASVSKVIDGKAKKGPSSSRAPKAKDTSSDRKAGSCTKLPKGGGRKNLQPLPIDLTPRITEGSPSSSLPSQVDGKIVQDSPQANTQVSDAEIGRGRSKSTVERKPRKSSVRATGKDSTKKGTQPKEVIPSRQTETSSNASISPAIFHVMQSNEMQAYGHIDVSNNKPYFVLAASTSSLPDLNSSASPSTVFQQPFTDFQQVQLRAQIFVYGALIQGTAPEETYMLSAFGGLDGGRSTWGNAWQASVERLQSQKSTPINPETPLHSRHSTLAITRTVDQVSKQSTVQNKGISTPVGRSITKSSQTVVSPMIPLSSPLWSMPTPVTDTMQSSVMPRGSVMDYPQAFTQMHPFQTPPIRNILGNNTSWMSQPSYRDPWVASPQPSVPDASTHFSVFPPTEVVQLTPVKEISISQPSAKHVSPGPTVQTGTPASVFAAASPLGDLKKVTPSHGQQSTDPKPRKRKKNSAPEETAQITLHSQPQLQPVLAPVVCSYMSGSAASKTPASFLSQPTDVHLAQPPLFDPVRKIDHDVGPRAFLSEESLRNIKETCKQAEDATALAAAAVGHSQEIWNQLEKQKNLGLVSDFEAKLASAAVAVTAAAAVARAAAAAANVASNAALQAKLMAEEAYVSNSFGNPSQSTRILSSESGSSLGKATTASILRGEDSGNSSGSILTAAREAARRKVEAASAASKRAENMDAIVKAAELAAEAVSQAGKIVAMGDPLSLSELVEAGPEGYWRAPQVSHDLVHQSTELSRELSKAGGAGDVPNSAKHSKGGRPSKRGIKMTPNEKLPISRDVTTELADEQLRLLDGSLGHVAALQKKTAERKVPNASDLTKNIIVVLESEPISNSFSFNVENEVDNEVQVPKGNNIKEGCKVEVFKAGDGFKAAWYTADVLSLNDGKACVSYTEIEQNEGSRQLEEWVALGGEQDNPPKIRSARPVTTLKYEGTRKRRRAAMGDYNWTVGDRVDAWINNSWWEGVVTEKNKKDETSITVHFPAESETSIVKAWHIRPSLKWKDGEWVEWSNLSHDSSLQAGDTPQEKRLKLGSPTMEVKGKDKISKSSDVLDSGKHEEHRLLELSGVEKAFNIGKSSKSEVKPDSTRMVRTGLQKEGSRVVFGVPKPGKKRKFMDVSKHYVADQSNKHDELGDSIKHLKYSAPQGSRALRNDPKEKRMAESKLKGLKPGKQQTAFGRTIPQKNFSASTVSTSDDSSADTVKLKDPRMNMTEAVSLSNPEVAADGTFVFSSGPTSGGPSSKRAISSAKPDRANKGKLGPAGRKLGKIEEDKIYHNDTTKSSEAVEPRRSNRRIQPTSRLLEGLQSSLILPKFPSFSYDKGQRSQSKNTSRGNNRS